MDMKKIAIRIASNERFQSITLLNCLPQTMLNKQKKKNQQLQCTVFSLIRLFLLDNVLYLHGKQFRIV